MVKVRKNAGFTLVEFLVVAAIISLLAIFAVPKLKNAADASRQTQVNHDLKVIQDALERHYTDLNYYPQKLNDLIKAGFLKPGVRFRSPVSGQWYLYAIDDNWDHHRPQAYILAAPGRSVSPEREFHHRGNLPAGRRPDFDAYAWVAWQGATQLILYRDDDVTVLPEAEYPATLDNYRTVCKQATGTPCDVVTN